MNESGSIFQDHVNMQHDATVSYDVEALTLKSLLRRIGANAVEILKLDLEVFLIGQRQQRSLRLFKRVVGLEPEVLVGECLVHRSVGVTETLR